MPIRFPSINSAIGLEHPRGGSFPQARQPRNGARALQVKAWLDTRKFAALFLLGFFLLMAPAFAGAVPSQTSRIGVLLSGFPIQSAEAQQFRKGLQALGYAEGRDVTIEWRSAEGDYSRLSRLLAEIVDGKPDVIVVEGTVAALHIKQMNTGIPIVMAVVDDPQASGLVESLARPGGDVTGLSTMATVIATTRLELLKESMPSLMRVGVLWDASVPWHESALVALDRAAIQLGIRMRPVRVGGKDALAVAFAELRRYRMEAVYVLDSALLGLNVDLLLPLARESGFPVVYDRTAWVKQGALMSYSVDFGDMFRRSARYVDRILKGEKTAEMAIEQPVKFELSINLNTAKRLKLRIPASIVERANEVIQ
jgi:putative ABC transport system substrate-binding protein